MAKYFMIKIPFLIVIIFDIRQQNFAKLRHLKILSINGMKLKKFLNQKNLKIFSHQFISNHLILLMLKNNPSLSLNE